MRTNNRAYLIGSVLLMIPGINIILGLLVLSYVVRYGRQVQRFQFGLSHWQNPLELLKEGFMLAIIILIWYIPSFVLLALGLIGAGITAPLAGSSALTISTTIVVTAIILAMITWVFVPLSLFRYAKHQRISAAFTKDVLHQGLRPGYLKYWTLAVVAYLITGLLLGIITTLLNFAGLSGNIIAVVLTGIVGFGINTLTFGLYAIGALPS